MIECESELLQFGNEVKVCELRRCQIAVNENWLKNELRERANEILENENWEKRRCLRLIKTQARHSAINESQCCALKPPHWKQNPGVTTGTAFPIPQPNSGAIGGSPLNISREFDGHQTHT